MLLQLFLHLLGYDIWFYTSHLILHLPFWYRHIHRIHHEARYPRFWDTYRGHWSEGLIQSVGFLLPYAVMECSVTPAILGLLFTNIRGMLRHDPRGAEIIGNHHLLHHAYPSFNYGEYWIDKLMGTSFPDERQLKRGYLYV